MVVVVGVVVVVVLDVDVVVAVVGVVDVVVVGVVGVVVVAVVKVADVEENVEVADELHPSTSQGHSHLEISGLKMRPSSEQCLRIPIPLLQ